MSNLNKILIVVLALQLGVTAFAFWPQPAAQAGGPLLANMSAVNVTKLTIHDSDGNSITLAKNGNDWVLPDAGNFPVQADKVLALLNKIEGITANRLVTQTEASHSRLKVGQSDYDRLIELQLADGTAHKLYVGSSAGAGATHVRADDQPAVYLTDLNTFDVNAQAAGWIDTQVVNIPRDDVTGVKLENSNGTVEFKKEGDSWTMAGLAEGEVLNQDALNSLLNSAVSLRMNAPVGQTAPAEAGFDKPLAVATLTYSSTNTLTLDVGAKSGENLYYLKSSDSPYYVTVAAVTGDTFVNKTRADFLQQLPAESTPADTPPPAAGQ